MWGVHGLPRLTLKPMHGMQTCSGCQYVCMSYAHSIIMYILYPINACGQINQLAKKLVAAFFDPACECRDPVQNLPPMRSSYIYREYLLVNLVV